MSDGPQKLAPKPALHLDEIILGDDEASASPPAPPPSPAEGGRSSVRPKEPTGKISVRPRSDPDATPIATSLAPPLGGSQPPPVPTEDPERANAKDTSRESRASRRAKMTLRIPDDEISRPTMPSVETPAGGIAALVTPTPGPTEVRPSKPPPVAPVASGSVAPPGPEVAPPSPVAVASPDDTLELPRDEVQRRLAVLTADGPKALGVDATSEPGWTPYQPAVVPPSDEHVVSPVHKAAAAVLDLADDTLDEPPPSSEEIPVDTDLEDAEPTVLKLEDRDDDLATNPRLPTVLDSEEIRLDDGDRLTEPGTEEVSPDDLVSVESLPNPGAPPPLRGGGPAPSPTPSKATPNVTGAALMAGAPVAAPSAPAVTAPAAAVTAPAVAVTAPAVAVAPAAPPSPQPTAAPAPAPAPAPTESPVANRRPPSNVIVPPVGALAPPPMNETAANRKKTRPWWEDLFNDDFIRTMAKLTDGQIGKEVDFIEESLGCEAGAMILDLACGTGRHAVDLASRGYQVVGFDLSLSMLARASDEAQDRNQKINFVQGDMREMTFEETFDGVYSWNTSFGYFDEEKNAAIVAKVHRALKKGGQFLLDVVNRDNVIRQSPSLAWYEGDGCICMDEMHIDWITSRMKVKRTLMMDDGRTKEIEYSIRVYSLHELGKLLHDNGFRVAEVSGQTGTPGVFFGCEAPRTLILAEKR